MGAGRKLVTGTRTLPFALCAAAIPLAVATHSYGQEAAPDAGAPEERRVSFETREGTALALDLSPDGRTIVFDLLGQLWTLPASGGSATPLTDAVRDQSEDLDPDYSPDGGSILFNGERGGVRGLWILEPGGGAARAITSIEELGWQGRATWSPDGRRVAFAAVTREVIDGRVDRTSRICIVDLAEGSRSCPRFDGLPSPSVRDPAWSPDVSRLAFVHQHALADERGGMIWVAPAEGGAARPLAADSLPALSPAWSPDGGRLGFFAPDSAGRWQVWVRDVATEREPAPARRLTDHADIAPTRVRWTPDGAALVYSADGRLWRVPASGGPAVEIPFVARVEIPRRESSLPPVRFPLPGEEQPARGHMGLALSADGGTIGLIALGKLWALPADSGPPRAVLESSSSAHGLALSPDGKVAAWSEGPPDEEQLRAADLAAGIARTIVALPGRQILPAWSPDGQRLAFAHALPDSEPHLRVVDVSRLPVTDLDQTRDLGPIDVRWYGEGAFAPIWSPTSQSLLVHDTPWPELPTEAEIVDLDGQRRPVASFPNAPIFVQWLADGSLVYVRHDRLWRASLDAMRAIAGAAVPLSDDPALYLSASSAGALLYVSGDGLRLREPDGEVRILGHPIVYRPPVPDPVLIRDVQVVDGTGASPEGRSDLLLAGGRIERIAPAGILDPTELRAGHPGLRVIEGAGRTAFPGLIDLHMHTYNPVILPDLQRYGVTTIRDQGSAIALTAAHADAIAAGIFPGPHVSFGAFQVYSDWPLDDEEGRGILPEADPGHIDRSIRLEAAFGAHHVKIRTFFRWDLNARFIEAAHRRGLRTTGHCAHILSLVAVGVDAKEHIGACGARGGPAHYDDLVRLYHEAGIGVVPTIVYWATAARLQAEPGILDSLGSFYRGSGQWMTQLTPEDRDDFLRATARGREAAVDLHRNGVTIGTGTDVHALPWALHDELEELVRAGLTPVEAIRAATLDAARILGAEDDLGSIAVGRRADLVIVEGDPVADIGTTRRIWRVIQDGRIVVGSE